MLTTHLDAVDVYKDQAMSQADELRPEDDEVSHHRVDLDEIFEGVVVKSEDDIDETLDRLRELLEEDGDVDIRFE